MKAPDPTDPRLIAFAQTIEGEPQNTIVPTHRVDTSGEHVLSDLSAEHDARQLGSRLAVGETIGKGGMGVIRIAEQRALGRKVAVKTLKDDVDSKDGAAVLTVLREAWMTGNLEHPNVVPVYDLGLDSEGRPMIVLKRIEGIAWSEVMHRPSAIQARFGAKSALEWNLDVLDRVINAVRYAHSRGILHRDIKPDNVMVGPFGEVYLLDWGISVSLTDDGGGRFPLAKDATEIAGTPAYMAPEMLAGGDALTEGTDVYLLGAVLYEIVTGDPPHLAEGAMAVIGKIAASEPDIPHRLPDDLRHILRSVLARDPDDRPEGAEALQTIIASFLEQRGSKKLALEATRRLEIMRGYAAAMEVENDPRARERMYDLYGECRFGFRAALDVWKGNDSARAQMQEATEVMVRYELGQDDPHAAHALLVRMVAPPEPLRQRVEGARQAQDAKARALEALAERGRGEDPAKGRRGRLIAGSILVTIFALGSLSTIWLYPNDADLDYPTLIAGPVALSVFAAGIGWFFRRELLATSFNRRAASLLVTAVLGVPLLHIGSMIGGTAPVTSHTHGLMLVAGAVVAAALIVDRRFWLSAAVMIAGYFVASAYPATRMLALTAGHLCVIAVIVWVWGGAVPTTTGTSSSRPAPERSTAASDRPRRPDRT